ncbi:cytochrome o ubiquinol oxidase subunit I [Buchnera aphidicola (Ceratoglyphina bambusae)]|uniref:cytochrome o ubiquinol oxidase subunit I n=1 Tax=Buchnera aphidicola TaxID=9 RepID=UPI0031B86C6C
MFGKLTLNDIPFNEPIIFFTFIVIILTVLILLFLITKNKKWIYLWNNWITSVDHKKIGIMYIILGLVMFFRGFVDALMMKSQQFISSYESIFNKNGFLPSYHYDQIFTVHGVIMIFFVAMPLIIGLINFVVPLQIGCRDLAFPFLNNLSFWLTVSGAILVNLSLFIGRFASNGWLSYPPLSEMQYSPDVGVDYWIWSLQISGLGTLLTGINFIVTILKMRTKGMSLFKMPIFTWTSLCSSILIVSSFPVLTGTILLLTLDRCFNFHFFTNDLGGNPMMYVNLIWIWGHPEVYILILPAFGIFSEVVSTFSRKTLFGYSSLVWASISITILSFIVWAHHFFTMGAGYNVNTFFGIATMIIAIPTGVKVFNWIFTMYKGNIFMHSSMLWTIGFLITFSIGGMSGVLLSLPAADFILHNSLFLVAHFHNVIIGGVIFGCFAGINYWFPKMFGFILNEKLGKVAFYFWIIGFFVTFIPVYLLGFLGMTRRISQKIDFEFHNLLFISLFGAILILIGIIFQIIQFVLSFKYKEILDNNRDPWNGRTLEWSLSSPPKFYNFYLLPKVNVIDQFWENKKNNSYSYINETNGFFIPKNTSIGFFIGIFVTLLGFSFIWKIFWLSIVSIFLIIIFWIFKIFSNENNYFINFKDFNNKNF